MSKRGAKSGQISSKKSKHFHRKAIHQAVAAACLSLAANVAFAACPAAVASIITIPGITTAADTCTLNTGESLLIDNAGLLRSAVVRSGVLAGSITNNGSVSGSSASIRVITGSSLTSLTNSGTISGNYGVYVDGSSASSSIIGTLTNNVGGIISGSSDGIHVQGASNIGTLTNSGSISSSNNYGIAINSTATISNLSNNTGGTISGNNNQGISLRSGGSITGTLTNNGTISGRTAGIGMRGSTGGSPSIGNLTNSGSISALSSSPVGISMINGASITGTLTNTGTISGRTGIFMRGSSGACLVCTSSIGTLNNSGTISGVGSSGSNAIGILMQDASITTLSNSGTISATGGSSSFGSTGRGISMSFNGNIGTLTNSSTISGTGGNGSIGSGGSGYGINLDNGTTGSFTSSGTISGTGGNGTSGGGGAGIFMGGGYTITSDLINNGTISGKGGNGSTSSGGGAGGITMSGGSIGGSLTNNAGGIISGTGGTGTIAGAGTGIYLSGATITGGIVNSGTIFGTTQAIRAGNNALTISNNATGVINGAISGAAVTVNNAGKIIIGETINSSYTGSYTQTATGSLSLGASSTASYGKFNVLGTATFPANAKLDVNVNAVNTLAVGNLLANVVTATTLNASTFVVTDNSTLFDFTGILDGNTIDLGLLVAGASGGSSVYSSALAAGNTNGLGAAGVLDSIIATNPTGPIGSAFLGLTTGQAVSNAATQTLPLIPGANAQTLMSTMHEAAHVVQSHLSEAKGSASGDSMLTDRHFWFKPFGSWADQDSRNGVAGYDARSYGGLFGVDAALNDANLLGFALGYSHSRLDSNSNIAPQDATIKHYQAILYGTHSIDDRTEINYQADLGLSRNDGERDITFAGVSAKSDYDTRTGHIGAGVSRLYSLNENTTLTPSIRADYTRLREEGYTETGAGAFNLRVKSDTVDELILFAAGKLNHAISDTTNFTANLGVGYDTLADKSSITSSYVGGGGAFVTDGIDPSPWLVRAGAGVVMKTSNALELSAGYNVEARSDLVNQTASVKVRVPF